MKLDNNINILTHIILNGNNIGPKQIKNKFINSKPKWWLFMF